jgi:hypothetical protein
MFFRSRLEKYRESVEHLERDKKRLKEKLEEKESTPPAASASLASLVPVSRQPAAGSSNAITRSLPHSEGMFDSVDFFRTAYHSVLQDIAANSFRAEAERKRPNDKESFYLDVIATGSIMMNYDRIWWPLYRSQLQALLALNGHNGFLPLGDFRKSYDEAQKEFHADYRRLKITFDDWMRYLTGNTLIHVHPSQMVEITLQGKDFLKYLLHWGRSESSKRL